jgi:GTP pyrophosphokinase
VIVIKLADRLHNMRTLQALREDRRLFKARETMEIYAPLAHRLGINSIKWELEDLSFYYLDPVRFGQIQRMVAESRAAREQYLEATIAEINGELTKIGVEAKITGRPKHLYSIYLKMVEKGKDFSKIYDLIALRLIVETVGECYICLGAVHTLWRPMPGRFKDYIAMPKFNMYQSLHTTVIGPAARPLEIQIRTKEMHRTSEYGVAAHWRYKEGRSAKGKETKGKGGKNDGFGAEFDEQLLWLRQMLDWVGDEDDPREFLNSFKRDLNYTEVFVFTPKGEVISLRSGSTPIDFAYAIHTEVGNHCVGAKVNGNIVPLSYELQVGDRVEILTQKSSGPSRDWLAIVKTPSARQKIRSYLSRVTRSDDILKGREILTREMRKHGLGLSAQRSTHAIKAVVEELRLNNPDDLFAQIGASKLKTTQIANKLLKLLAQPAKDADAEKDGVASLDELTSALLSEQTLRVRRPRSHPGTAVRVKGLDGVLVRLSHCCNPVPGDEIIGFVTRGRGVSVHRTNCPNARELMLSPERIIEVAWENQQADGVYNVEIFIEGIDRLRLLQDVTLVLANSGVNIIGANTTTHRDGIVEMRFLFELAEVAAIEKILGQLMQVEGIIGARRRMPGDSIRKHRDFRT